MIDIKRLLDKKEDEHLEAKSAKGGFPDSLWESYSAFANTDGGTILLGVEENADHTLYIQEGLADAEKMKDTFWKLVNNRQKVSHNVMTNQMVCIEQYDGKNILVIEVPRTERTARPVYKGLDPRKGTYRRWGEGDHLCSIDEVTAMLRDASATALDAASIKEMDMTVFCKDSIKSYRNVFRVANPNHLWNQLDDALFLRRINAVAMADDGCYHPTEAGLLMFGYEYEITGHFPQYFLDYQEERTIMHVWSKVYHTEASIIEKEGSVDRTILTLPFNGNEQDVQAMLQLYDDSSGSCMDNRTTHSSDTDTVATDTKTISKDTLRRPNDTGITNKQRKVLEYCQNPQSSKDILSYIGVSYHSKNIKKYITELVEKGYLRMTEPSNPRDPRQKYFTTTL